MTPMTPSCRSPAYKLPRCKPRERWTGEFAGSGPKEHNAGSPPCPSSHRSMEASDNLYRCWIQPWDLKKASVFIQVPGKAVGAASCALSIPGSRAGTGTARPQPQHVGSGKQTQTQTKCKNTIKHRGSHHLPDGIHKQEGVTSIFGSRRRSVYHT